MNAPEKNLLTDRNGNPRQGNYMHTAGGEKFFPFDPRPEEVKIETIAHHLACQGRYAGATVHPTDSGRIFYSVAEHSVYVARYVEQVLKMPEIALEALLHDAPEAFLQDMIRPLKYHPIFREPYKKLEDLNMRAIATRFNLQYPFPEAIKIADEAVTTTECETIIVRSPDDEWGSGMCHDNSKSANIAIAMMNPIDAKMFFTREFVRLAWVRNKYRSLPDDIL